MGELGTDGGQCSESLMIIFLMLAFSESMFFGSADGGVRCPFSKIHVIKLVMYIHR